MNREQISDSIKRIINETAGQAIEILDNTQTFNEQGVIMDSLAYLNLLANVERYFSVDIADDLWEYHAFQSVEELTNYITSAIEKGS